MTFYCWFTDKENKALDLAANTSTLTPPFLPCSTPITTKNSFSPCVPDEPYLPVKSMS